MSITRVSSLLKSVAGWPLLTASIGIWAFAASLGYFYLKQTPDDRTLASIESANREFAALEGMPPSKREQTVAEWLARADGNAPVLLSIRACDVYALSACNESATSVAIDQAFEADLGGPLLAPVRGASAACMSILGNQCPRSLRVLNRKGYEDDVAAYAKRSRAALPPIAAASTRLDQHAES